MLLLPKGGTQTWDEPTSKRTFTAFPLPGQRGDEVIPLFLDPTDDLRLAVNVPADEGYAGRRRVMIDPNTLPVARLRRERRCPSAARSIGAPESYARTDAPAPRARPDAPSEPIDRNAVITAMAADSGLIAPFVGAQSSLRMRQPIDPDAGPGDGVFDPGDSCPVENLFEDAVPPDRLYIRASAVNELAPGSDRHCSPYVSPPSDDKRPFCVHRQAFTNPVWLEIRRDPARICRTTGGDVAIQ